MEKIEVDLDLSDKELKRLKRSELLEILLDQSRENDALKIELEEKNRIIEELNAKLNDRKIVLQEAGTIAEASFKLNGVFEAAEKAAEQYLDNLKDLYEREQYLVSEKEVEAERKCALLLRAANEHCDSMKEDAKKHCDDMVQAAEAKCICKEKRSRRKMHLASEVRYLRNQFQKKEKLWLKKIRKSENLQRNR